jgi:hypothetical protein
MRDLSCFLDETEKPFTRASNPFSVFHVMSVRAVKEVFDFECAWRVNRMDLTKLKGVSSLQLAEASEHIAIRNSNLHKSEIARRISGIVDADKVQS